MYKICGIVKGYFETEKSLKAGGSFTIRELQIEGKASNGKCIIENIRVPEKKIDEAKALKEGSKVELPVSVIVNNGFKNVYLA